MRRSFLDRPHWMEGQAPRIILASILVAIVGAVAIDALLLSPHRELEAKLRRAESRLIAERRLLKRAGEIRVRYLEIQAQGPGAADAATTESDMLARVSQLAGPQVVVRSVSPRRTTDGRTLQLDLDFEGPFPAVVAYLETLVERSPSEITRLSLAADPRNVGHVSGRMSIEVVGLEY